MAALLIGSLVFAPTVSHAARPADTEQWAKGRILVMPKAGLPENELAKILKVHGGKARKIGQSNLYIVDLPGNASEKAVVALLSHNTHLKFAELDQRVTPAFISNDPYLGSEWHLSKIGAPSAWDYSQGAGVTIAILDSGVNGAHADLAAQMVPGWNFYDNNANTADVHGHGTAVAGSAAASTNNGAGVASVAGQSKIMPIRIADANAYAYWSTVAQGLTYAADHGARVANISYVGVAGSASVKSAAQYMKNTGGLVAVCAGNNGIDENITPTDTMIVVSATDTNDVRPSWSSYGSFVAVSAPGVGIWTTSRDGAYQQKNGTSFASPITAGVIASMMAANPAMKNTQIEKLLYSTARDLGAVGRDPYYGYGRVNASGAVQAALNTMPAPDTQAPTVSILAPLGSSTVMGIVPVTVAATDDVGVVRVELRVNGTTAAIDSVAPFGFSWDSSGVADGMSNMVAYAYDAAGNARASAPVSVNVANGLAVVIKDTTAPTVRIVNPVAGNVSGNVSITVNASDDSAAAGISQAIYVDGVLKATGTGTSLVVNWNTRKVAAGLHTIQAVVKDAAGNTSSTYVQVTK
ncbi:MAG: S8 family serine peptidase [Pseudomonadota bacterium]|nr:S8 family serine peptidase [Pseudomonadota bacterium]